jgi:DNA-binding response OmpR family regulator
LNGFEATKTLRAKTEPEKIPIIAITAMSNTEGFNEVGWNDYIVKPFTPDKLLRKITSLIR